MSLFSEYYPLINKRGVYRAFIQTVVYINEEGQNHTCKSNKNKIEIQSIDALFEVLEFTTFSNYFVFYLSDIQT